MKKKHLHEAAEFIQDRAGGPIDCAIVLGSGFSGVLRDRIEGEAVSYKKLAGFPTPTVAGHTGDAYIGELHGRRVVAFASRRCSSPRRPVRRRSCSPTPPVA
jgi:purine-nucleoside phosphorylase